MGVCQWARAPGGARAHSIREWLLFIHPAEMTFQMRRIASMQMRGLFNMNDRPLNSYYYMAHCHNYVVHLVSLSPSPSPSSPKGWERKGHLQWHPPSFHSPSSKLAVRATTLLCPCDCWKGTTFPSLGERAARFSLLSPANERAHTTPEARLCPLGPRSFQISEQLVWDSELEAALCPAGLELEERERESGVGSGLLLSSHFLTPS